MNQTSHSSLPPSPVDVCLVTMPYLHLMRPSIALGILKAVLTRSGISCSVEYANLRFAAAIGLERNSMTMQFRTDSLLGEWTFSEAAFRDGRHSIAEILGRAHLHQPSNIPSCSLDETEYTATLQWLRNFAPEFIESTAQRILARRPKIVGCTSTFEQHCPSLALLRRIKELDSSVTTLLGGANCEGEMGWVTLKNSDWLDFVVSGEAEEVLPALCRDLLDSSLSKEPPTLPLGVLSRKQILMGREAAFPNGAIPRAMLADLDQSPTPDYTEYFETLVETGLAPFVEPALAVESSRGCWWGQKSQCTFCGLNGAALHYRTKSTERVLEEWQELTAKHQIRKISVVDNIIAPIHLRELLPKITQMGAPFEIFYETKANLRKEQVQAFAKAGVVKIQPGIESLHDDLLKLMSKGVTAVINARLLKYTREAGIQVTWYLLAGFPGEDPAWHQEVAQWLPQIFHLQPPNGVIHIRMDRFSSYFTHPEQYNLELRPFPAYAAVYPFSPEDLMDIAYFFRNTRADKPADYLPKIQALGERVKEWRTVFSRAVPPVFTVDDLGTELRFFDTRPCAPERRTTLSGLARDLYLACNHATTRATLENRFPATPERSAILDDLVARKLVLEIHGQLLALACEGDMPTLDRENDKVNGHVHRFDPTRHRSILEAWNSLKTSPANAPR